MILYIVRHGETIANRKHICQGQTHGVLTEEGIAEAHKIGERLAHIPMDICYSSDLRRAMDTARCIVEERTDDLTIIPDVRLRERYFGSFQGQVFPTNPDDYFFSEAEPPSLIAARLLDFMAELEQKHPDDRVLIVSHGFTLRILLTLLYGLEAEKWDQMPELLNTALSVVHGPHPYHIELLNDISHLKEHPDTRIQVGVS